MTWRSLRSRYVLATSWEEQLVWLERRGPYTQLTWCPKDTSTIINNLFFSASIQTILTSATLTNTQDGELEEQYSYFVRSTGFPLGDAGMLAEPKPSPYLYDEHALIYYCNDLPHPTKEREEFIQQGGGAPDPASGDLSWHGAGAFYCKD